MITLFVNILVPVNWCKKITSGFGPKARLKFILPNCCISFCKIFCRITVLWFKTVSFQYNNLIGCNILMVNKNLDGIKNALVQIDRRPFSTFSILSLPSISAVFPHICSSWWHTSHLCYQSHFPSEPLMELIAKMRSMSSAGTNVGNDCWNW